MDSGTLQIGVPIPVPLSFAATPCDSPEISQMMWGVWVCMTVLTTGGQLWVSMPVPCLTAYDNRLLIT